MNTVYVATQSLEDTFVWRKRDFKLKDYPDLAVFYTSDGALDYELRYNTKIEILPSVYEYYIGMFNEETGKLKRVRTVKMKVTFEGEEW